MVKGYLADMRNLRDIATIDKVERYISTHPTIRLVIIIFGGNHLRNMTNIISHRRTLENHEINTKIIKSIDDTIKQFKTLRNNPFAFSQMSTSHKEDIDFILADSEYMNLDKIFDDLLKDI